MAVSALRNLSHSQWSGRFVNRAFIMIGVVTSPCVALCEKDMKDRNVLVKDIHGNTDWVKSFSRVPQPDFWDDLATMAGRRVQRVLDSGLPTDLSYGFLAGFTSGYALKAIGRIAATTIGMTFIGLQALAYNGYIDVNHAAIKRDVEALLDRNKDGRIDRKDQELMMQQLLELLQYNMPSGSGFVLGFVGGLRSG